MQQISYISALEEINCTLYVVFPMLHTKHNIQLKEKNPDVSVCQEYPNKVNPFISFHVLLPGKCSFNYVYSEYV